MLDLVGTTTGVVELDVYGLRVSITGDWREVVDAVAADFAWFARATPSAERPSNGPHVSVTISRRPPDASRFGELPQTFITSRNVVYRSGDKTIVDYGPVLAMYDSRSATFTVEGEHEHLVHEATYLFLLFRIGRHLDQSGLTRVHALGLSGRQGAVLVLLPSGGGKTTLALRALNDPRGKLLSEDTPLIDRHGFVHPFPLRLGVNESDAQWLPPGETRRIERLEYGPKLLVSLDAYAERIERAPQPIAHIVIGRRWLQGGGRLHPLSRSALVAPLIRDGVIGLGVAQMIEYVLRQGRAGALSQARIAASRAVCCAQALVHARTWRLELSRDPEINWSALVQLLE